MISFKTGCIIESMIPMYLIINSTGMRLCEDLRWRSFANFGTYSECVKEYKRKFCAIKIAKRYGGSVVLIPENHTVDASGSVFDETFNEVHDIFEFVL